MYVDLKMTMADILSNTEMGSLPDVSDSDEPATSEDDLESATDGSGLEVIPDETSSDINIFEETLVDGNGNSAVEILNHIDSTLTIILIVILLIWMSNHLHIIAKTFGKIGKGV